MIRIKSKIDSAVPEVLNTRGAEETELLKGLYNVGEREFTFRPEVYGHKEVKQRLIELQHGKCCFCESKITHIAYGDVEHYRPKAGWVQNDKAINKPGYYWLAYDWNNLFLSCQVCNQRYKKNYFPLVTEGTRARNHNEDVDLEDPLFIDPVNDDPEDYIYFNEDAAEAVNNNARATTTIANLGLDRRELNEQRKEKLNMVKEIYDLAKDFPDNPPDLKKKAKDRITKYYEKSGKDETEYASMLRCFFKKNPIDF